MVISCGEWASMPKKSMVLIENVTKLFVFPIHNHSPGTA